MPPDVDALRHERRAPTWAAALLGALTSSCGAASPVESGAPGLSPPPGAAPTVAPRLVGQAQRWGLSTPSVDGLVVAEGGAVIDGRTGRTVDVLDAALCWKGGDDDRRDAASIAFVGR